MQEDNKDNNLDMDSMFASDEGANSTMPSFFDAPAEQNEAVVDKNDIEPASSDDISDIQPIADENANDVEIHSKEEIQKEQDIIPVTTSSDEEVPSTLFNSEQTGQAENSLEEENETSSDPNELIAVRPVKFEKFVEKAPNRSIKKNLDIMQDISMHISVELGRTKSSIREVMEMDIGSIIELEKTAGEQVEIYVNGKLVAKGEVIVIEDKFGVRVVSTSLSKQNNE